MDTNHIIDNEVPAARGKGRSRIAAMALSAGLGLGALAFSGAAPASAASPGPFNYAQCVPSYAAVIQDVEVYRSTANEYVQLQGALVNSATGATIYSQWAVGSGSTAHAAFRYGSVPRGQYNVWYHWAVWNAVSRTYVYSGWVQVTGAALQTYGYETQPGIFVGGSTGRCSI
jgi:hypothetical protein